VNAKAVAEAHRMDVLLENEHCCKCLTYWIDELRGCVFCLIDAPDKESVIELHTKAHGLVPSQIIEVEPSLVQAFLGRITDPENAAVTESGLKIFDDAAYRIILHVQTTDRVLLGSNSGPVDKLEALHTDIRKIITQYQGREVSGEADEVLASFVDAEKAWAASKNILDSYRRSPETGLRISLHAGEPVAQSDKLFGDTLQLLRRLNAFEREKPLMLTSGIRTLLRAEKLAESDPGLLNNCSPKEENFVTAVFEALESRYSDEQFTMDECCRMVAMSQSQLYRKTVRQFGLSPNNLLRNYRLLRAKELLRKADKSISQVSFDTGFSSASYFTKCFKARYGLLPLNYQEQWHQKADCPEFAIH
jgi:AraC-like DNA-binding protein